MISCFEVLDFAFPGMLPGSILQSASGRILQRIQCLGNMILVGEVAEAQQHSPFLVNHKCLPAWDDKEMLFDPHS